MNRLKEIREHLGFSQQKMADELNEKRYRINDMESGKSKIQVDFAQLVEEKFNINPWWLLTGKGSMHDTSTAPHTPNNLISIPYLPNTYAQAGGGAINYDDTKTALQFDADFLVAHLGIRHFKNLHIINAIGDSMQPTIFCNELLFVNPIENEMGITTGAIYVINIAGEVIVKRIEKNPLTKTLTLRSDNTVYKPITVENDALDSVHIIGRVVGHFARL